MKATELMIGDWVLEDGTPQRITLTRIVENYIPDMALSYKPIPLTEEILEKNFGKADKDKDYNILTEGQGDTYVHTEKDGFYFMFGRTAYCDYNMYIKVETVHKFQHTLRLCGLHELADNFKVL